MALQTRAPFIYTVSRFSSIRNDGSKNNFCDACLRAKQTRKLFSLSENKATNCFDLIHCDIWATYHVKSFLSAQYFLNILDDAIEVFRLI